MKNQESYIKKGADISECGKYRYNLWRVWDENKAMVLWLMHNPSTADGMDDDPTITRIVNFSKDWGYGGILVHNLSPFRATKPATMKGLSDEILFPDGFIGIENYAERKFGNIELKVAAFGKPYNPVFKSKLRKMKTFLRADNLEWHYLDLTKDGWPSHPLYLKSTLKPAPFSFGFPI